MVPNPSHVSMSVDTTSEVSITIITSIPALLVVNVGIKCFQVSSYTKLMALTVSITVINYQTFECNCTNVPNVPVI